MKLVDKTFPLQKRILLDSSGKPIVSSLSDKRHIVLSQGEAAWSYYNGREPEDPTPLKTDCYLNHGLNLSLIRICEDSDIIISDELDALLDLNSALWEKTKYEDGNDVMIRCAIESYSRYAFIYKNLDTGDLVGKPGLTAAFSDFGDKLRMIYSAMFGRSSKTSPIPFEKKIVNANNRSGSDSRGVVRSTLDMMYGIKSFFNLVTSKRFYETAITNGGHFSFLDAQEWCDPSFFYLPLIRDYFELEIDFSFVCGSVFVYELLFSNAVKVVPNFDVYIPEGVMKNDIGETSLFKIYRTYKLPSVQLSLSTSGSTEYSTASFRARISVPSNARLFTIVPYLHFEIPSFDSFAGAFSYVGGESQTDGEGLRYESEGQSTDAVRISLNCSGAYNIRYCGPWRGGTPSGNPVVYD